VNDRRSKAKPSKPRKTPSFIGLSAASDTASKLARASSKKSGTRCESVLRRELWQRGHRYRISHPDLPGKPDIIFKQHKVVVFCDGDFWHGRDLPERLAKLRKVHNAPYWQKKIAGNVLRDERNTMALRQAGWKVIRLWETDILRDPSGAADAVEREVGGRRQLERWRSQRHGST
jgi:DNA mismatch endonuclease (patch repair protein)